MIPITESNVNLLIGHPVFVVLQDGSYCLGMVAAVDNDELVLRDIAGAGKTSRQRNGSDKAQISSFLRPFLGGGGGSSFNPFSFGMQNPQTNNPMMSNPFGNMFGNNQAAGGQGGGAFSGLTRMWPHVRLGFGLLRFILPMFGFSI